MNQYWYQTLYEQRNLSLSPRFEGMECFLTRQNQPEALTYFYYLVVRSPETRLSTMLTPFLAVGVIS